MKEHNKTEKLEAFSKILDIMDELREKCPWDRKQTLQSLKTLTIEEVYELTDALSEENAEEIKKELGDVFLHLIFYSKIASEKQWFDIADVLTSLREKLIERHPHIYGDIVAENQEEVKKNWEKIKLEKGNKSVLAGVPKNLPAMVKAMRIQEKVSAIGFDWQSSEEVYNKVKEEIQELQNAVKEQDTKNIEKELGDVIFSLVNYARFLKVNPENSLELTNKKFISRFKLMEEMIQQKDLKITNLSLEEMDKFWEETKKEFP